MTMYSATGRKPRYVRGHRRRSAFPLGRALAALLAFVTAAAGLSGGLILLGFSGVDVVALAAPLALLAVGGAAFTAMIVALNPAR